MFSGTSEAKDGRGRAHMDVLVACPGNIHRHNRSVFPASTENYLIQSEISPQPTREIA
jgi:hypothetical protein